MKNLRFLTSLPDPAAASHHRQEPLEVLSRAVPFEPVSFPLQTHLGMTLASRGAGSASARLDVKDELRNPNGVLHGAALFALVDTSMGAATMSVLPAGHVCASIEVQLRFLTPVRTGRVVAEASVLRQGARIVHLE
jgi:acyl-CoA thioesterase